MWPSAQLRREFARASDIGRHIIFSSYRRTISTPHEANVDAIFSIPVTIHEVRVTDVQVASTGEDASKVIRSTTPTQAGSEFNADFHGPGAHCALGLVNPSGGGDPTFALP
jgi:hypothetical protein